MEQIVEPTSHFLYRCGTCQTELNLGLLACINKGNFIFYEIDESSVNEQPYGLLCAIFPSKMKVRCATCRAKLGYSGRGLSYMDRAQFCYKLNCAALSMEARNEAATVERIPIRKSAASSSEAAAQEAKKEEINALRRNILAKLHRRKRCAAVLRALLVT